jgi:hypothetical protein
LCDSSQPHEENFVFVLIISFIVSPLPSIKGILPQQQWVDSVFNSLSNDEKIAQLIVIRSFSNEADVPRALELVKTIMSAPYVFFRADRSGRLMLPNLYQSVVKTPLMVTIDAEWGVGMRLDSVAKFPYQLTLGP